MKYAFHYAAAFPSQVLPHPRVNMSSHSRLNRAQYNVPHSPISPFMYGHVRIQQPQPSRVCCDGVVAFSCIWSGKSLYWSCCSSCASALRAASWNACSTLIASFALDSNDATPPLRLHHWCSCFVVTLYWTTWTVNLVGGVAQWLALFSAWTKLPYAGLS